MYAPNIDEVPDGSETFASGADGGRTPHLIDPTGYEEADNVVCRQGDAQTRAPFVDLPLTFDNPDLWYNSLGFFQGQTGGFGQSQYNFKYGKFQGALYYNPSPGKEYFIVSIGGRIYRIAISETGGTVFEIALHQRNRSTIPIHYHCQAGRYMIIQDGEQLPIIFDNMIARRASNKEIPVGLMMGHGMGRIVLIRVDGGIEFGDIFNGQGNGDTDMLGWTETTFLNEGGATRLPAQMGFPTGIIFPPRQDTATGVGECFVFGESGCETFFLSIPREQWKNSIFQVTGLIGIGNRGHRNLCAINQDVFLRSEDGWRSYRQARAEANTWAQIPLSTNVKKWVDADEKTLLQFGSAIAFDNRLLVTCTPYANAYVGNPYHNGGLSLDFDVISSFGQTSSPAWDGHFSEPTLQYRTNPHLGLRAAQFVKGRFNGRERAFMFVFDVATGTLVLREFMKELDGEDSAGPITSLLRPKSFPFRTPYNLKELYQGNAWISNVKAPSVFTAKFRSDQGEFYDWGNPFKVDPNDTTEGADDTEVRKPGLSPRLWDLQKPPTKIDPVTKREIANGYEFQPEITWTGRAGLRRVRMVAIDPLERMKARLQPITP